MTVRLSEPVLGGNEAAYLQECVDSTFVSSVGAFVDRFEREMAHRLGAGHAVACSSGTAALHVAFVALGIDAASEVVVPTFTFVASANAVAYTGARTLLVDSERRSWNMDTERLRDEVVARARRGDRLPDAIEVVHILGQPADMAPLLELSSEYGIPLVEDAAEALGATVDTGAGDGPRHVGTLGTVGCLSFNGNKLITTGGGGMVLTDDGDLAARIRHLTTQAKLPGAGYEHDMVGYNYRLTNVAAALGVAQLEQLEGFLSARRQVAERYRAAFAPMPEVEMAPGLPGAAPSHWLSCVLLADRARRDAVRQHLADEGIEARPVWLPLHRQAPYRDAPRLGGEVADELADRGLALPSSASLTPADQQRVIDAVRSSLTGAPSAVPDATTATGSRGAPAPDDAPASAGSP
jgi:dTDP-4-amino-4,6-dideoxygalactose transaminase